MELVATGEMAYLLARLQFTLAHYTALLFRLRQLNRRLDDGDRDGTHLAVLHELQFLGVFLDVLEAAADGLGLRDGPGKHVVSVQRTVEEELRMGDIDQQGLQPLKCLCP